MNKDKMNRRAFLQKLAGSGLVAAGAMITLSACETRPAQGPAKKKADCTDLSMLTPAEVKTREALKYVDVSPKPGQTCATCKLYRKLPDGCAGCTVLKGPVAASGWCTAFAVRG